MSHSSFGAFPANRRLFLDHRTAGAASDETPRLPLLGHAGALLWLTGLSGAGKSTLARGLEQALYQRRVLSTIVDGDVLRAGLCSDLGFSIADRRENLRRATELALHLAGAGAIVIVAMISPFRYDRGVARNRAQVKGVGFAEVFVNASLAVCEMRDPKGLYRRARAGTLPDFTGIDSPYEAPLQPDLELRTDQESMRSCVERLIDLTDTLARRRERMQVTA